MDKLIEMMAIKGQYSKTGIDWINVTSSGEKQDWIGVAEKMLSVILDNIELVAVVCPDCSGSCITIFELMCPTCKGHGVIPRRLTCQKK